MPFSATHCCRFCGSIYHNGGCAEHAEIAGLWERATLRATVERLRIAIDKVLALNGKSVPIATIREAKQILSAAKEFGGAICPKCGAEMEPNGSIVGACWVCVGCKGSDERQKGGE